MTDASADTIEEGAKPTKMPIVIGLLAGMLAAGGGFYATFSGLFLAPESISVAKQDIDMTGPVPDVAYVEVDPIIVTLGTPARGRYLQFRAQLEVPAQYSSDVELLMPRVVDVLNGYLRALEPRDIESASALIRLRAQMLRRVQIVAGADRVIDLLIMEFVVN